MVFATIVYLLKVDPLQKSEHSYIQREREREERAVLSRYSRLLML